ncbi:DUF3616 domain-containing protein [Pseudoduganella umbonata]|uniref:DUF3616 domain-containing protein n=1 Tax=Pseudoduganella umbonata TaxID=864828 RepID=A0A4V1ED83_9BURK|nr:DUF3616 domain-containing protein [Pseudoduganella umbonata]MBB3220196.1 hypothetical protein [Pseudoduganella umbonata]QCP10181.1 DUF3616 domain-containing protein [Pseudoduganella umbonata]
MTATGAHSHFTHYRICDASAAVPLGDKEFIAADDESNVLHVYRYDEGPPVRECDLTDLLDTPDGGEADIEGAAELDGRIWWITSHGCDRKGRSSATRRQLFATDPQGQPVGKPYRRLLEDLAEHPLLAHFELDKAARKAPKDPGGLCIEGLAATPGGGLLIGFRNPIPHGWALLVPLADPAALLDGGRATLGAPILLDLAGHGIRAIEWYEDAWYIAAGPPAGGDDYALYRWSGRAGDQPVQLDVPGLAGLHPEALFFDAHGTLHVLSDDGKAQPGGRKCKDLPVEERTFRRLSVPRPEWDDRRGA